jgi:hypothetical protein
MKITRSLAIVLALSLSAKAAPAQVSDADRAAARALSAEGHEALAKNDYATAADRFARADGLIHAPTLMLGLARAQVGLGKLVTAQETYRRILREGAPAGSPAPFFRALKDAQAEVDALAPRIPFLIIKTSGAGAARITIDGVEVPNLLLGAKRPVDPGEHVIRAVSDGSAATERTVKLVEREGETVTLELTPLQADKPPAVERAVAAPIAPLTPPGGEDPMKASAQKTIGVAALAVGGAGLALGGVMGGLALARHGVLKGKCTVPPDNRCPLSEKSDLDAYSTLGAISTAGFVAGGAVAVLGTVLVLTAPRPKPRDGAWIAPVIGVGYAGAKGAF